MYDVITYIIYALIDPRDQSIYYVGCTCKPVQRKSQHLRGHDKTSAAVVSQDLINHDMEPGFKELDAIDTTDERYALALEAFWRVKLSHAGEPIVNQRQTGLKWNTTPDAINQRIDLVKEWSLRPYESYEALKARLAVTGLRG